MAVGRTGVCPTGADAELLVGALEQEPVVEVALMVAGRNRAHAADHSARALEPVFGLERLATVLEGEVRLTISVSSTISSSSEYMGSPGTRNRGRWLEAGVAAGTDESGCEAALPAGPDTVARLDGVGTARYWP